MSATTPSWEFVTGGAGAAVRSTTARVMAQSHHVVVDTRAVPAAMATLLAAGLADMDIPKGAWGAHVLHPKGGSLADADLVFVIDTLNFSFWADSPEQLFTGRFGWVGLSWVSVTPTVWRAFFFFYCLPTFTIGS